MMIMYYDDKSKEFYINAYKNLCNDIVVWKI